MVHCYLDNVESERCQRQHTGQTQAWVRCEVGCCEFGLGILRRGRCKVGSDVVRTGCCDGGLNVMRKGWYEVV